MTDPVAVVADPVAVVADPVAAVADPVATTAVSPTPAGVASPVAPAGWYPLAKRTMDLVLAVAALVVLSPVLVAIGLAVRLTSRGPALFRQERVGRHEVPFTCFKFRTMVVGNDDTEHRRTVAAQIAGEQVEGAEDGSFKLAHDPRVTRVGAVLRRTSLDELPQLLNVVRGEMSLVGPRPSLPWEVELFEPRFRQRASVVPGITGLWQVSGRSRLSYRQALELDLEYVRTRSLRLDAEILVRTLRAVVDGDGAR